jgi:hypothetical protein
MPVIRKAARLLVAALASFALVFGVVVLVWAVYPYDGLRVGETTVLTPAVEVGGTVSWVNADVCNDGYDVLSIRWMDRYIDGELAVSYALPPVEFFVSEPFCAASLPANMVLPNYVKPGTYRARITQQYQPNPLFQRAFDVVTPPFEVVAAP